MSPSSDIDRESFQTFLASAFAVQESGLNSRALSALAEIQRFVRSDGFDRDKAMQIMADQALQVSGASGIAIALIENNELVYRAGSGCAATDIGRRVPAVLSVTSAERPRREILRVENAGADTRIEAEICRQFGAMSLLMLPIYGTQALAGVLQVLSQAPHHFDDWEVRTYRLMIAALENGISQHAVGVCKDEKVRVFEQVFANPVDTREALEPAEESVAKSLVGETGEQYLPEAPSETDNEAVFQQAEPTAWFTCRTMPDPAKRTALWIALKNALHSADLRHAGAAVGIAVALIIAVWASRHDHLSTKNLVSSTPAVRDAHLEGTAQPSSVKGDAVDVDDQNANVAENKDTSSAGPGFRRVRVSPNEVDEISEDVTIRYFEIRHAKLGTLRNAKEVKFGDDVTVRYFADVAGTGSRPRKASESSTVRFQSR